MKKIIVLIMGLLFLSLGLIAQVTPPESIPDALANIGVYAGTLGGLAVLSTFLTGFVNGIFTFTAKWLKRLVSWLIPVVTSVILGYFLNIGFLAEATLGAVILNGLLAGLASNGLFTITQIHTIVDILESALNKKK